MLKVLGLKKEMTQIFADDGQVVPVTIIDINGQVIAKKDNGKVWIGFGKKNRPIKSEIGNYKELGYVPSFVTEVESEKLSDKNVGDELKVDLLENVKNVDITGESKGKGFAGVVKRWGFHGGPKTHGQSDRHRAPGSIGSGTTPGRVYKGKKMAGRMGGRQITVQNLKIIKTDMENGFVMVKGAVPGSKNSVVTINVQE